MALAATACTGGATPAADEVTALGLSFPLPDGFERADLEHDERPRDSQLLWVGPEGEDGTSVGVTAVRLCHAPLPSWQEVLALAEGGDHTGWSRYRLAGPPEPVEVDGALDAVRVRGTYQLRVASTDAETTLVHDELLIRSADDVVHRLRVEGSVANVRTLPIDDLLAAVRVTSTACPV